jgi:hypothetical protein
VADIISDENHDEVFNSHVLAWKEVWNNGRIEVEGNVGLGKVIYGSLYYILSSLPVTTKTNSPVGQFYGLSPGGLAYGTLSNDYQGNNLINLLIENLVFVFGTVYVCWRRRVSQILIFSRAFVLGHGDMDVPNCSVFLPESRSPASQLPSPRSPGS